MKATNFQLSILIVIGFLLACNTNNKSAGVEKDETKQDTIHPITPETVNAYAPVDKSPMDMSYYPVEYTKQKMENSGVPDPMMRVIYSRPYLQGRKLFPQIIKYGDRWRLGANEATEIQFYRNVTIQKKSIKAGRYVLFCIPEEDTWQIVFNANVDSWGLKQDTTKDLYKFTIPVTHHNPALEYFTAVFEKATTGANLILAWDEELAKLQIDF